MLHPDLSFPFSLHPFPTSFLSHIHFSFNKMAGLPGYPFKCNKICFQNSHQGWARQSSRRKMVPSAGKRVTDIPSSTVASPTRTSSYTAKIYAEDQAQTHEEFKKTFILNTTLFKSILKCFNAIPSTEFGIIPKTLL